MFYKYVKKNYSQALKWLHPQINRSLLSEANSVEGREGVDFLFSPPWRDPIVIEILGEQHWTIENDEELDDPNTSSKFQRIIKDSEIEVVGIPAKQVKAEEGDLWDKVVSMMECPEDYSGVGDDKNRLDSLKRLLEDLWLQY